MISTELPYQVVYLRQLGALSIYCIQLINMDNNSARRQWAFPYWPGYHPETPILARDAVGGHHGSRDDSQANMEMPMY
jgi:hypothetical protein